MAKIRKQGVIMTMVQSNKKCPPPTVYGKSLGIAILTGLQLLIGLIHLLFGLRLLAYEDLSALPATAVYGSYTFMFGVLVIVFAYGIWLSKKVGWFGTIAVSVFVIIADSSAFLGSPIIPGTPVSPAAAEICYSSILIAFLLRGRIKKFLFS
jgi:hypothetical protein